jgi:hypothetical protein
MTRDYAPLTTPEIPLRLDIRHAVPCTVSRFWEMYWSDTFDALQQQDSSVQREVLQHDDDGKRMVRRVQFTPNHTIPRPAAKLLGTNKLTYEQHNTWDRSTNFMTWQVLPTILPGKVNCAGKLELTEMGPGKCQFRVHGDIEVKIRFIGGQFEKTIVDAVTKGHATMAANCLKWLEQHGA